MNSESTPKELTVSEKSAVEVKNGEPTREGPMFVPQTDIEENSAAITLRADLPGVRKEDVDIDIRDDVLTLTAKVAPVQLGRPVFHEYDIGGYTRRFSIGERIDRDGISATMEHGVLTLVLPKAEKHRPRRISVQ